MAIKSLLKTYPDLFVIRAKIWTDKRNTIESEGSHDPLIGALVSALLCFRYPRSETERAAMESLLGILRTPVNLQ